MKKEELLKLGYTFDGSKFLKSIGDHVIQLFLSTDNVSVVRRIIKGGVAIDIKKFKRLSSIEGDNIFTEIFSSTITNHINNSSSVKEEIAKEEVTNRKLTENLLTDKPKAFNINQILQGTKDKVDIIKFINKREVK